MFGFAGALKGLGAKKKVKTATPGGTPNPRAHGLRMQEKRKRSNRAKIARGHKTGPTY